MKKLFVSLVFLLVLATYISAADDLTAKIKKQETMKNFLASTKGNLLGVKDIGDLYEIAVEYNKEKSIIYMTRDGRYLLLGGNLFDKNRNNLTRKAYREITRVDFPRIPLKEAITIKKGDGSRKIVMITDPDCDFCKKSYEWLKTKTDYTLYVFLYPLSMHSTAQQKSIKILCSNDPAEAFDQAESGKPIPDPICNAGSDRLKRQKAFAEDIGINGTPVFIFEDGERIEGFEVKELETYLQ